MSDDSQPIEELKTDEELRSDLERYSEAELAYSNDEIGFDEFRSECKATLGWYDCPDCSWEAASAPAEFYDPGPSMRIHCPECDHTFADFPSEEVET